MDYNLENKIKFILLNLKIYRDNWYSKIMIFKNYEIQNFEIQNKDG
jgi:hypothetical protein